MSEPSRAYLADSATYGDPPVYPKPTSGAVSEVGEEPSPVVTPPDPISGLFTLGSTYNVLNGKYADSKSALQQVIDWKKTESHVQTFGGKQYTVPEAVNFNYNTTSDYRSSYGKTTSDYTKSLSIHAGFEASFRGFSASASADYSESQRETLSNAFTRVTFNVTHFSLSLPTTNQIKTLLKPWFVHDLDNMDPIDLYKEYGTHLLRSITIGGRAMFLYTTDTRSYRSEMSLEAAAKLSASYAIASGSMEMSASQKSAMESFNQSSETSVSTKGGDPRYGNEDFLKNVESWAASITNYPEFVDFGSLPCFVGIWEFASTKERRDALQSAYAQYVQLYTQDLSLPGPYLQARSSTNLDDSKDALFAVGANTELGSFTVKFPTNRSDGWYFITPTIKNQECTIAKELVPGALAPVTWVEAFVVNYLDKVSRFWRAVPPTSDYIALGFVAMTRNKLEDIPAQPPAELAGQFRAVHKRALTAATRGTGTWKWDGPGNRKLFAIDFRYWFADLEVPRTEDCFVLDPKMVVREWTGW